MVNKTSLVSLSFFSSIWWITDDRLIICVVEKYLQLGLNYFIPLKKTQFTACKLLYKLNT